MNIAPGWIMTHARHYGVWHEGLALVTDISQFTLIRQWLPSQRVHSNLHNKIGHMWHSVDLT